MGVSREAGPTIRIKRIDERYFSARLFREWCARKYPGYGTKRLALILGVHRRDVARYKKGTFSPNLETYCRMLAMTGEPFGSWIDTGAR